MLKFTDATFGDVVYYDGPAKVASVDFQCLGYVEICFRAKNLRILRLFVVKNLDCAVVPLRDLPKSINI